MLEKHKLMPQLAAKPSLTQNFLYGIQWAIFIYSLNLLYPLVIGNLFNMSQFETAALIQRSIFLIGVCSMLQVFWGHRLPLIEGVSALWFSIFILFAQTAGSLGQNTEDLLRQIGFGLILVGGIIFFLSYLGLIDWLQKLFTPLVTGSTVILLAFQVSGSFVKGMFGYQDGRINGYVALFSIGIASFVTYLSFKGNKFLKSFSVLLGMILGWGLYTLLQLPNQGPGQVVAVDRIIYLPQLFAWGTPQLSSGMAITAIVAALVLISNQVASIAAMKEALDHELPAEVGKRCGMVNGIANVLCGCFAGIGTIPLANSAGFIKLTGVGSKEPFAVASFMLMLIGLTWPLGQFFTMMPAAVAYAVSFAAFSQMIGIGFSSLLRVDLTQRNLLIIGLTLLTSVGLMFLPPTAYIGLPIVLQTVVSNGLLMGIILVLLLEHIVFRNE